MVIRNINSVNSTVSYGTGSRNLARTSAVINPSAISFGNQTAVQKFLASISQNFSSPHQRAVLGVTALCTQPFIDLHNRHIKKEDKPITVARTIAKIIVGTAVGVALRHYSIKAIQKYTNAVSCGKYSQSFVPKKILGELSTNPDYIEYLKNYKNGLGTFIGTMGGLFTNFAVDAPLTKKLTNLIHEKVFKKEDKHVR